jgi:integrase/recombinase XerD
VERLPGFSVYAELRVGEIAALFIGDVATQSGEARREIKLGAHQTKGSKGRTVVLSNCVRAEIDAYLKIRTLHRHDAPLVASQRNARPFSNVSLSMLFKEIYEAAGIRTSSHSGRRTFATRLNAKGVGMRTIQKLIGHRHIGTTALYWYPSGIAFNYPHLAECSDGAHKVLRHRNRP